jgi:alkyl hydroperoxide reductase subunit F
VTGIEWADDERRVKVKGGETFAARAVIITTGASWRRLGVEGESQYLGHGIHFCPHCDGPFYKGRRVAVVGGGNSGIEAAIDLAAIASHVTVVEFLDTLRADRILIDKAKSLGNVNILTSRQTMEVKGDGTTLKSLAIKDRKTEEISDLEVDGVFVQIGLSPNSDFVRDLLELSPRHEIIVDEHCRTSRKGIYAAGDVTNVPFKQIIIAMGEGAKAALSVNEDIIRGVI